MPMLYCVFLTVLLLHRAKRDEEKCLAKYGEDFRRYMELVPYRVVPGVY
jgi:protein-S-isoprenylcysteine O-methyltransferase Ste14